MRFLGLRTTQLIAPPPNYRYVQTETACTRSFLSSIASGRSAVSGGVLKIADVSDPPQPTGTASVRFD